MLRRALSVVFASLVALGCRGVPVAPAPTSVTFARLPVAPGGHFRCTTKLAITVQEQLPDGGVVESSELRAADFLFAPLAVVDGGVTRARLTYASKGATTTREGRESPSDPRVVGPEWELDASGDELMVRGGTGEAEQSADRSSVREEAWLLGADPVRDALPARALLVGAPVPELVGVVKHLFRGVTHGDDDGALLEGVVVTLAEVSPATARFDVVAHLGSADAKVQAQGVFHGELEVRLSDSMLTRFSLAGPLAVAMPEDGVMHRATATLSARFTRADVPAAAVSPSPAR